MRQSELPGAKNWQKLSPSQRRRIHYRAMRYRPLTQNERHAIERSDHPIEIDVVSSPHLVAQLATSVRAYTDGMREGKRRMSLFGKMQHLTESAQDFHKETEADLDAIAAKIETAREKKNLAKQAHHTYYDTIINGVDESIAVIERLSNGPLPEGGDHSQ